MAFEVEVERYNELLPELLASSKGKFVVIKGREMLGVFDDMDEGYRAALDRYGITDFLLRAVREVQPVLDLTNLHFGVVRGGV